METVKAAPPAVTQKPEQESDGEKVEQRQAIGARRFASAGAAASGGSPGSMEHLDIPAFLRKQAD